LNKSHPPDADDRRRGAHLSDDFDDTSDDQYDEAPISPIGRLMDDNIDTTEEPSAYVKGFDRPPAREPARRREPPPPAEPPAAPAPERERRPRRERPTVSRQPEIDPDEDFFEAGIREVRARDRSRESRRPSNPDPRPAVRASVPTQRRMAAPPPDHQQMEEHATYPPEDAYDSFRKRYDPGELISASRGRQSRDEGRPTRGGYTSGGRDVAAHADEDGEGLNPMRMILAGLALGVLLLMVFLVISRASRGTRISELEAQVASMEEAYASTQRNLNRIAELEGLNSAHERTIADLNAQIVVQSNLDAQQPGDNNDAQPSENNDNGEEAVAQNPLRIPAYHTVERGQSLSSIARLHYGPCTASEIHALAEQIRIYNNITNANHIQVGDRINLPQQLQ